MSKARICDVCSKSFRKENGFYMDVQGAIASKEQEDAWTTKATYIIHKDLCKKCWDRVKKVIKI